MNILEKCRASTNKDDDRFVGIRFNKEVEIIFPIGFDVPKTERELKESIFFLFDSFGLTDSKKEKEYNEGNDYLEDFRLPIHSYFWLLNDYVHNGLFFSREKVASHNSRGKINWKKTIQKERPVISKQGFVYLSPFFEHSRDADTIITEIEKYCLHLSAELFGWLFGSVEISESMFSDVHITYMRDFLKKEIPISYSDHKRNLLKHMHRILSETDEDVIRSRTYLFGTEGYNMVWQKMMDDLFGNVDIRNYLPRTKWNLVMDNIREKTNSPLQPDTIHYDAKRNRYLILDAKYYNSFMNNDLSGLPGTTDIEKQITYGQELAIREQIDPYKIYNAMILPYNKKSNNLGLQDDLAFAGIAETSWTENRFPFERVELIFADSRFILNSWKRRKSEEISDLMEIVELNSKRI